MYGNYTEHPGSGTTPKTSDTERQLLVKILLSTNAGGGGGGGTGDVRQGNYAGGQPDFTPASGAGIGFDNSNGRVWNYYGGQWQ